MIVIFDTELKGHHLEYVHHLWTFIAENNLASEYYFVLPESEWRTLSPLKNWLNSDKINLRLLKDSELQIHYRLPIFKRCRKESTLISNIIKEIGNVSEVVFINLPVVMPVLPFIIGNHIKISGIVYTIDLYANYRGFRGIKERLVLRLYAKNKKFKNVFLLNSAKSVEIYNKKYKTDSFKHLVDPVPLVDFTNLKDLHLKYGLNNENNVFLHFGAMQKRKGTLILLDAIKLINDKSKNAFIFAGKISKDIKEEFYIKVNRLKEEGYKIFIHDEFVDFNDLYNLCYTCDCILAPYLDTACSSGVIGYGAVFNKPIIGSSNGLLGELIKDNDLGQTIDIDKYQLSNAINEFSKFERVRTSYSLNTIDKFNQTILINE